MNKTAQKHRSKQLLFPYIITVIIFVLIIVLLAFWEVTLLRSNSHSAITSSQGASF